MDAVCEGAAIVGAAAGADALGATLAEGEGESKEAGAS